MSHTNEATLFYQIWYLVLESPCPSLSLLLQRTAVRVNSPYLYICVAFYVLWEPSTFRVTHQLKEFSTVASQQQDLALISFSLGFIFQQTQDWADLRLNTVAPADNGKWEWESPPSLIYWLNTHQEIRLSPSKNTSCHACVDIISLRNCWGSRREGYVLESV